MAYALISSGQGTVTTGAIDSTGADLLVVLAVGGFLTITDSKSNSWSALTQGTQDFTDCRISYSRPTSVGSGHTFTTGGSYMAVLVAAFSGSVVSPFDQENGGVSNDGTSGSGGSVTPTENNELVIAGLGLGGNGSSPSVDSGFTIAQSKNAVSGVNFGGALAYKIQTTAGAVNPGWTWTTASDAVMRTATFKDTPSSSAVGPLTSGGALAHGRLINGGRLVRAPSMWLPERFVA